MSTLRRGSFDAFWEWWWPSITSWLPEVLRAALNPERALRVVTWDGAALHVADTLSEGKAHPTILLVPARLALVRALELPSAAVPRLREVVRHEIERQTPFTVEQVYFDAVVRRVIDPRAPRIEVSLVVVPTHLLDPALDAAASATSKLVGVDVISEEGPLGANLLPAPRRYRPSQYWRNWNRVLGLVCGIACIGVLVGMVHARERGAEALEQQTRMLMQQAADVRQRELALRTLDQGGRSTAPDAPKAWEVLAVLSAAMPLDSHMSHIEIDRQRITARGQTADLAGMLKALRQPSLWGDPELTGSRTLPDGRRQDFSLRLHVRDSTPTRTP